MNDDVRPHPGPFPQERVRIQRRRLTNDVLRECMISERDRALGVCGRTRRAPSPGVADEVSAKDKSISGRGEGGPTSNYFLHHTVTLLLTVTAALFATAMQASAAPTEFKHAGDWDIQVTFADSGGSPVSTVVRVTPPEWVTVSAEKYDSLPVFNPNAGGWVKGVQLVGVRAQETTTPYLLDTDSLVLRAGPKADSEIFRRGEAYEADLSWGTLGRTTNNVIGANQPVYASYRHAQLRLDAVVLTREGRVELRKGKPLSAAPSAAEVLSLIHI